MADVSNEEAEDAMKQFAEITGTDEIFAQTILQDVNWKLEAALEVFYGSGTADPADVIQITNGTRDSEVVEEKSDLTGLEISLLSWNIDGLDGNSLATRMLAVSKIVSRVNADFVFLQEVVERDLDKLMKLKKLYEVYFSNRDAQYYTAILVSKVFTVTSHNVVHYSNSGMGRSLQIVEGKLGPLHIFLLNTHLESTADHSDKRKKQLEECLHKMNTLSNDYPDALIFFGGDLNIRDREMESLPRGFADAWMAAGANKKNEFTWDTQKNKNKDVRYGVRCRFDRIFFKATPLAKVQFSLEGQQLIRTCLCYPSDHWAVHCVFSAS